MNAAARTSQEGRLLLINLVAARISRNEKSRRLANRRRGGLNGLLRDLVDALPRFFFRRFDLDAVLLAGNADKAAHAMRLPVGRFHNLCERDTLSACDHLRDLRVLALGTPARRLTFGPNGG